MPPANMCVCEHPVGETARRSTRNQKPASRLPAEELPNRATLSRWCKNDCENKVSSAPSFGKDEGFRIGEWHYCVKTEDRNLITELQEYCRSISHVDRADVLFTCKLFALTEERKIAPWGWVKQKIRAV